MTKDKTIPVPVTIQEKKDIERFAIKAGYRSVAEYMRDKAMNK